jgi:hypothetical protein
MKYRSIKTPPRAGNISVKDAVKSARTVARSAITGRFVKAKGSNSRTTIIIHKELRTSPPSKVKKTAGKSHTSVSKTKNLARKK